MWSRLGCVIHFIQGGVSGRESRTAGMVIVLVGRFRVTTIPRDRDTRVTALSHYLAHDIPLMAKPHSSISSAQVGKQFVELKSA